MNDFTKEELECIAEAVDMWFKGDDSNRSEMIYLKVKSMIDNYCEHKDGHEQDSMMVDICKRCNKVIL